MTIVSNSERTMLQPRAMAARNRPESVNLFADINTNNTSVGGDNMRRRKMAPISGITKSIGIYAIVSLIFLSGFTLCQGNHNEEISAERVKRDVTSGDGDVTTVLLVDNQKLNKDVNARNGRYLNVKPVIGLLTSTARTFIQDGVTTEYATEILGTTLDNGRVYAQLLTKSSLVLYDKPIDVNPERKTRLPFEMDDRNRWNLEQSLGELDRSQFVIKNTDYVSPKDGADLFTVYASKPVQNTYSTVWNSGPQIQDEVTTEHENEVESQTENLRVQEVKEIPKYNEFEAFNFLDPIPLPRERKISAYNNINIEIKNDERTNKALGVSSDSNENAISQNKKPQAKGIDPVKVNPNVKLPTYTVKNEFSPIFYYIDNVESKTEKSSSAPNYLKSAKKLFGHKEEHKPLKTFTYYGFSNFTTIVGDTVIVFSPSTATEATKPEEITPSVKPEVQPNIATRVKTFLSSDLNMLTKTMFGHQLNMETAIPTIVMNPQDLDRSSKALKNGEENLKTVLYEKPMQEEEQILKPDDKFSRVIASLKEGLFNRQKTQFVNNKDVIQTSEMTYSTILRTHSTEKLHVNEETIKDDKVFTIKSTEPLSLFSPTSVLQAGEVEKETLIAETTTASPSEENVTEVDSTTENDSETSPYTEDTLSTPSEEEDEEETNEEIESNSEDATCTGGIIPVSTVTTSYKTLTYLTTYFIPLEGTETTTSIKSSEVVTSETGYLTNLACKTEETVTIEPTLTLTEQIDSTKSIQTKEEVVTEANTPVLTTTSEAPVVDQTTTEKVKETTEQIETTTQSDNENKITVDDKSVDYSTTEHAVTTSESHIEVSVTTEESAVSLDSRHNVETTTESKEETTTESEGEIDLIFKTLYTTYTYFTTYFQGETSTVSSKKSVVTNVITSTLDLSEIDPSIFNAIESSDYLFKATQMEELGDIQPTSVGIGRPTQAFSLNSIIDLVQHRQVIDSVENDAILTSKIQTPELDDEKLFNDVKADVVKTFYTTYTFFTTLYVEQDANICSRTEVYTNYVGPSSLIPTKTSQINSLNTRSNEIDFKNCKKVPADQVVKQDKETLEIEATKPKQQTYSSIDRSNKKTAEISTETSGSDKEDDINEVVLNSGDSMLVTDVKRSYSKGDRQIIDNSVLDDQVSSESNIDEILPSPTLLLQTSFTTFTYFTTMYVGKDSSKVKSRLETVTNVVTETLNPKSVEVEETNLPITYYTTFTYWTTLYKDKTTTITSREDIVSNVVTPTVQSVTANPIDTSPIEVSTVQIAATHKEKSDDDEETTNKPMTAVDDLLSDDGKATFFTTYTYFTTYYVGNTSELRSSLETITNVVDNTKDLVNENQLGRAVGKDSPSGNLIGGDEKPIIVSTVLPDAIVPTKVSENIIISTQLVGTLNEVDLDKKIISSQVAIISGDSTIIAGSQNNTDSTTPKDEDSILTTPGITTIEGSVTEPTTPQDGEDGEGYEDEDGDPNDENNTRKKSRLTFSTRKRTFTPVIRPFVSRTRSTFSPKRVTLTSGATTITRSDFTQTITATPALKSSKTSGFGGNRKQPSSAYPGGAGGRGRFSRTSSGIAATSSSSTRTSGFGRGRSSDIQPANARRGGFRTSTARPNIDFSSRSISPKIRPTLSSKYRGNKQTTTPSLNDDTLATATDNPSTTDDESATQSTDVDSRKTTNPLLRFRRPPFTRAQISTTPRSVAQTTTRRGSFNRGRTGSITTTQKPTQRSTQNPLFALRNRQRPNALFPPRGLINKQPEPQPEEENNAENENDENEDDLEGEGADEDSDYESSDREESQILTTTTTQAPKRISNSPAIKPFGFRRRTKRQTDYGTRRSYANFRRPAARTPKPEPVTSEPEPEVVSSPPKRTQGRFSSRNSAQQTPKPATRAPATAKPAIKGRQPFILRGESKNTSPTTQRSTFRSRSARPTSRTSSPAPNLRPKAPRLKTYATAQPEAPRSTSRSSNRRTTSRGRTTSRYRTTTNDVVDNNFINYQIPNDGKLTITHKIPMEVTIPVVNGKLTEYKNVLTAQPSIEILQPNQYSTTKNAFGSQYTVLVSESSIPAENGATKVIQFILHETPTTSVIFTPTVINRRKTSFSHIIPSTVYEVERVTSTIQPQINANVPLANILLSQLLLGNLGMPQPINPLLALQGQAGIPQTPTTEYKTKTTTYVTTVTDAKSTVLPITFRGKEILTTIIDSKVDVITATEFITETVVVTPTPGYPGVGQNPNQINSILLLLQQQQVQQQQQQQQQQTANPLLGLQPELNQQLFSNDLLNSPKPEVLDVKDPEDYLGDFVDEEVTRPPKRPSRRKTVKNKKPAPVQQTSIITLYVSGRTPGEFSTVLSTVVVDETQSVQKREAVYFEEYDVTPPNLPNINEVVVSSQSDLMLDSFLMPAMNDMSHNTITQAETQSLESIIGEVSKYMALEKSSSILETAASDPTVVYVVKQSDEMTDFTPVIDYDGSSWHPVEARGFLFNEDGVRFPSDRSEPRQKHILATRVMSNGVEVIVANSDKTDAIPSEKSKHLRIVTTPDGDKTTTLAPSTVKNNVRMTIAVEDQGRNNSAQQQQLTPSHPRHQSLLSSSTSTTFEPYHQYNHHHQNTELLPNPQRHNFVIKTCYTTFTYLTTTVQKMRTTVSTYETVVSTITTEPIDFATVPPAIEAQKTTQPQLQMFQSTKAAQNIPILQPKIEKRVDEDQSNHDLIQPSEVTHPTSCSLTSCPCTVTLTESLKEKLKTKLPEDVNDDAPLQLKRSPFKPTKYSSTIVDTSPTVIGDYKKENIKINKHNNKQGSPPPEKVVQKYTEVVNDQSNDSNKKGDKNKHSNSKPIVAEQSNKRNVTKNVEDKRKPVNTPEKTKEPQKVQKNKFEVADLLKLGTLGIKKLAPMIEQMTGSFIRRQEQTKPSTTTVRPASKITPYVVNKRVDDFQIPNKPNSNSQFPIYIPVDEKDIDTSESQNIYYNSTLQQNLAWHNVKNSRNNLAFGKPIHESPLLNGGIPISPGEIITTNSDVIVGKPVVGGPNIGHISKPDLKQNNGPPPNFHADSHSQSSNFQDVRAKPPQRGQGIKQIPFIRDDDTYDLRPPMMLMPRPPADNKNQFNQNGNVRPDLPKPDSQHFIQRPQENNQHFIQHPPDNQNFNQQSQDNSQHFNQRPPNNQNFNQHAQDNKQQFNQHPPNNQHFNQHLPNNQHFNQHAQESKQQFNQQHPQENQQFKQLPPNKQPKPHNVLVDHVSGSIHSADTLLENHGRPAFLDYIPALDSPGSYQNYVKNNLITRKTHDDTNQFNSLDKNKPPTPKLPQQENKFNFVNSAQNQNKKIKEAPEPILLNDLVQKNTMKPFLVDIQPSRVANVIIPHGNSASALIFAGSSEPHKNGEYIDDPLPYPEPGYFGSFSIDAPHLTSVHVGGTIPIKPNPDQRPNGPINNNPDPLVVHHGVSGLVKDVKPPHGQRWKYEEPQKQPTNFPNFAKLPAPISNQESNINFGPHFVLKKPDSFNTIEFSHNNNNNNKNPPPIRNLKSTAKPPTDYAVDLAVPPPPPAVHVKYESNVGVLNSNFNKFENRPHFSGSMPQSEASHKHPTYVQNNNQQQHSPPKITSEVYFASTASNGGDFGQKLKPFTVNIPLQQNFNNRPPHPHPPIPVQENTFENNKFVNTFEGGLVTLNAGSKVNIPNPGIQIPNYNVRVPNSPVSNTHYSVPQNGGLITLNAGTSVFNPNLPEQTISGTNIPVSNNKPTFNTHNVKEFHAHEGESTGIKIGTNLAIKVEPQVIQAYNPDIQYGMGGIGSVSTAEFKPHVKGPEIIVGGNSWKAGSLTDDFAENEGNNGVPDNVHIGNQKVHVVHASSFNINDYNQSKPTSKYNISNIISNSHANFPMSRENSTYYNKYETVNSNNQNFNFKPLNGGNSQVKFKYEDYQINTNKSNSQRPIVVQAINSKPEPDFNTIQYGTTENKNQFTFVSQTVRPPSKIPQYPQLKVESTTHKIIPLSFDFESERYGDQSKNGIFGQKLHSVGLPPTNFNWQQNRPILNPKDKYVPDFKGIDQFMAPPPLTTPQYNPAYIPSNFNSNRQPVYDIPTKDHVDNRYNTTKQTTQYITSNVYNTIEENKYQHVAQESVKVAVISSTPHTLTNEVTVNFRPLKNASRLKDEILVSSGNDYIHYGGDKRKPTFNADDNTGSQTEEPFNENKYKEISIATLPEIKQTTQPAYNVLPFSQMAPRPFTINENVKTTTNVQNGDAQRPRPFQKPDKLSLNIGEISVKTTTRTTPIIVANITENIISITTQKPRPQLSIKNNTLTYNNKIITSNYNVPTNKPIVVTNTTVETSTLPTFTIPDRSNVSSIIPNLSPPPPAVADYNFKGTNEDDTIMGMSPPPKTPAPKQPTKEYTKYADISTFRPGYNSVKNPYKRPGDYYRITSRPFTRYTTPSTPSHRHKVTSGTTITRIVLPSRASIPSWKSPVRVETKLPVQFTKTHMTTNSIINTTPLDNVGSEIMHPDTYPEENIGVGSVIKSDPIVPDKVSRPVIYPTIVQQSKSSTPILNYDLTLIQTSENFLNENAIRKTETLKYAPTINPNEQASKSSKTLTHKFTIPTAQTISSVDREITINPVHHAGNEIIQSDDHRPNNKLESLTAITFTTTLERPVSTVMTTRFVTLTHTLTVTQTKTSVVSPVVGSTTQTQTLTLTNTQTSTIVDVVTEVHTLVQPTTIVETITKHVSATTLPAWETKYPKVPIEPTRIRDNPYRVKETLDLADVSLSSNEEDLIITPDNSTIEMFMNHNDTSHEENNNTFLVVMTKSQSGGSSPNINPVMIMDNPDSGEATRIEEIGTDGVSHVLLGEILLAGNEYVNKPHPVKPTGVAYGKECQPDCKASRNERCQRMHGLMKCVCRPGFARMFPDRPCKPTYTYSMRLALSRYGNKKLTYQDAFADQNTEDFQDLAMATHEGINRMVMQSDLRDVYHGVHINGFQPVKIPVRDGKHINGVLNDFYVQLSDNAHETRLKEVIEKYLRNNNYSLGGTNVYAAEELVDKLEVGDFNECMSNQFHDCSEHAECFNLRATYTCSCREGYADLSVNSLYPGRICSAEPVGCEKCNYHGTCYTRDDARVLCECFQWYAGDHCHINLKVILISLATLGAILFTLLLICLILTCAKKRRPNSSKHTNSTRRSQIPPNVMTSCIGNLPVMHQSGMQSSKMHSTIDRRALIQERGNDSGGEGSSVHNMSLPYIPTKKVSQVSHKSNKKLSLSDEGPSRDKKPFTLMIPRAKYHPAPTTSPLMMDPGIRDSKMGGKRKTSGESNETKLLSYLDAGPGACNDHMNRRKQSNESSYSMNKAMPQKYSTGALVSAGFKVSTTVMGGIDLDSCLKEIPDDGSSVAKSNTLPMMDMQSQFNSLRKAYSQEDINDWTDAERRIGELTMSEARSFDGTLVKPSTKIMRSTTGSNKSSAHYTQHEANTMAERDLGSTFLLPHVHLYKPDMGSDVSEFDSL